MKKLIPKRVKEVADQLLPDEIKEQFAAIDTGLHSLRTEPSLGARSSSLKVRAQVAR